MANFFSRFIKDESGATAIEYGLIASLISVAAIVAFTTVGSKLSATFGLSPASSIPKLRQRRQGRDTISALRRQRADFAALPLVMMRQQGYVADREFRRRRPCLFFERKVFRGRLKRLGRASI